MQKIFIAGCGYIGGRVARLYRDSGADVTCMLRSPELAATLSGEGFSTVTCSLDKAEEIPNLDTAGSILHYLVPPPGGGIADTRARNFIAALSRVQKPSKIIYVSATSVYSENSGGIVTEESETKPSSAMGKRRLDAENAFLQYGAATGTPVVILRVSGVYGPGRLPLMQISQGQALLKEEESGPSNRIHADDLAAVCLAAAESGEAGEIFNVSDGSPTSMTSYFNACADALKMPRQPQVPLDEARLVMSPLMFSYVSESRVIDNNRMLKRLKVNLRYPDIQTGLASCLPG
ncbi:MAG TPA: NAD(P)-dependent oxidoreductase [Geobacter sp.]|nr:NAD(P)-dependent oxidoreductase [Geobacter sp.]